MADFMTDFVTDCVTDFCISSRWGNRLVGHMLDYVTVSKKQILFLLFKPIPQSCSYIYMNTAYFQKVTFVPVDLSHQIMYFCDLVLTSKFLHQERQK